MVSSQGNFLEVHLVDRSASFVDADEVRQRVLVDVPDLEVRVANIFAVEGRACVPLHDWMRALDYRSQEW